MKNAILTIATLTVLGVGYAAFSANQASAGLFDQILTADWPTKKSDAFKVEAYGFDFRVYEWQTENDPNTFCTVAIGNADQSPYMGLHCFQKSK